MRIIVTTIVDRTWPSHKVQVESDDGVTIATGESQTSVGGSNATVQFAARDVIYKMERQLAQVKKHLVLNGLLPPES
jgi:hypothetical protein